jgi:hypothetical protein
MPYALSGRSKRRRRRRRRRRKKKKFPYTSLITLPGLVYKLVLKGPASNCRKNGHKSYET